MREAVTLNSRIEKIVGRGIPIRGNDIDTDRILPAQYMRTVTFAGLENYLFAFERSALKGKHPIDDPRFQGASILFVNKNFGCGSSREHAPQALKRWGIRAIVGESFAEIFFGNCLAIGIPCVTVSEDEIEKCMRVTEEDPSTEWELDLKEKILLTPLRTIPVSIPESARKRFLEGTWDALPTLLEGLPLIEEMREKVPYLKWVKKRDLSEKPFSR
jgi:3-isopropylmalate/(R)-2-methylmalate dehydratase small subunit